MPDDKDNNKLQLSSNGSVLYSVTLGTEKGLNVSFNSVKLNVIDPITIEKIWPPEIYL